MPVKSFAGRLPANLLGATTFQGIALRDCPCVCDGLRCLPFPEGGFIPVPDTVMSEFAVRPSLNIEARLRESPDDSVASH